MRILVLSQYFWPESFIINDIVRILDEQGHEVTVATGKPNYPDGKIFKGYHASGAQRERYLSRIEVLRVPIWPRGKGGVKNLILNYLSFVFSGLVFLPWMLRKHKFDAILVFAPSPIIQAIPAIPLKWLKSAQLTLWIQDLWPESLSATGFVKNTYFIKAIGRIVQCIYHFCDTLLVQSRAFVEPVSAYACREKIVYYPNSIDARPRVDSEPIPDTLRELLDQYFCVVFAGNLGTAQALDTLVQAAVCLRDDPQLRLVLIGSGSRLPWLKAQQQTLGLENLIMPGRFSMEAMPQIFKHASALLVSLNDEKPFSQTIPSKIQAYLAAGRPIIACMNGEGARIIEEANAGFASPAEQVLPLVENIRRMKVLSIVERSSMATSGKAYFDAHFDMHVQARRLIELLRR